MSIDAVSDRTEYRPFAAFALVWAISSLIHQLAFTFWTESWEGWVLVLTAIALVYRPDCVLRFAIHAIASLLQLWDKLPFVPNHILYEGMLHLIMLLGAIGFFFRGKGRIELVRAGSDWMSRLLLLGIAGLLKAAYFFLPFFPQGYLLGAVTTLFLLFALWRVLFPSPTVGGGEDYFGRIAPVLRAAVLIMYVWAVIQKLNWDYFNPDVSCAGQLHDEIAAYFGNLIPTGRWTHVPVAVGSLVFEFGIPILLYCRRTRYVGFVAAIAFHLWLSIHPAAGIFSFTTLILSILFLFLPIEWGRAMQTSWDKQLQWLGGGEIGRGRRRSRALVVGLFFAVLITQGTLYLTIARSYEVFWTANRIGFFAFFVWGLWIGASFLVGGWCGGRTAGAMPNRAQATLAWVGLLPVLLNGLWPWLGGRTQTSFSMYSNLRSEATGNHLFLRRADVFDLQKDMVEVLTAAPDILGPSSRPRGIQQFANLGHRILPWFEFRRLVSEHDGDFEVTYTRKGREESLGRKDGQTHGDPEAFEPLPLLHRKFLWFRRLESLEGPMGCTH
ncbi:MAG: hypothetical protein B9S36_01455 [Verrucomicrobiia bacterium Tous-C2TDCM]|nr:MAG: hypothetical protein B9S36_01455 [Verrucomicrobiae bacterium Tous-C2TDCM]